MTPATYCRSAAAPGFSLVEVVMAVGIVAISALAVVGLLPHGLAVTKKTGDLTYQTRIFQQIVSEHQAMPWSLITGTGAGKDKRLYDYQGVELTGGQSGLTSFVVETEVVNDGVNLPGGTENENLRRLVVRIANSTSSSYSFNSNQPGTVAIYSTLLAKTN